MFCLASGIFCLASGPCVRHAPRARFGSVSARAPHERGLEVSPHEQQPVSQKQAQIRKKAFSTSSLVQRGGSRTYSFYTGLNKKCFLFSARKGPPVTHGFALFKREASQATSVHGISQTPTKAFSLSPWLRRAAAEGFPPLSPRSHAQIQGPLHAGHFEDHSHS